MKNYQKNSLCDNFEHVLPAFVKIKSKIRGDVIDGELCKGNNVSNKVDESNSIVSYFVGYHHKIDNDIFNVIDFI